MKPVHFAVVLAVLVAGALVYLALDSDDAPRAGRKVRPRDDITEGPGIADDKDAPTAPAGDGALSCTLRVEMMDGTAAGRAKVEIYGRARLSLAADDKGSLSITGLHPGLYSVAARRGSAVGTLAFELKEVSDLTLTLANGITVRGRVLDATDQPVPGALVEAILTSARKQNADMMQRALEMLKPDTVAGRALTAADGAYELAVPRGRALSFRATAAGYGLETEPTRTLFADVEGLDFRMFPAGNLTGKVVNTAGAPVAGAHVLIVNMEAMMTGRTRKAETTTSARGEFRLPLVSGGGEAMLVVRATGYATHIEQQLSAASGGITVTLERGVTLRLRTVDDIKQQPAPGVQVLAIHYASFATGVTGPDGRLEIEHLAQRASGTMEERQLWVQGGLYVPRMVDLSDAKAKDGVLDAGDIEVSRGGTVSGRVLEQATDRPIAGALLRAIPGGGGIEMIAGSSTKSGTDGSFELTGVPLDAVGIVAVHPDYTSELPNMFNLDNATPIFLEKQRTAKRDLRLAPAAKIAGVVIDPDGKPVAGAQLMANDEEMFFGAMMGWLPPAPISGADGRFVFHGISKGTTFTVTATHREYSPSKSVEVVAGKGGEISVKLERPARLRGRVLDPAGKPLAGVRVSGNRDGQTEAMFDVANPGLGGLRPTVTSSTGHYLLPNVPPGEITIRFDHPQFVPTERKVVVDGKEQKLADTRLRRGLQIAGIVVDGDGTPLPGIVVAASVRGENEGRSDATVSTGDDGRFSMGGFSGDGRFRVEASGRGWFEAKTTAQPGMTDLKLVMRKPAQLKGRVVWNGQPVAGATVTAFRPGENAATVPAGADKAMRAEFRRMSRDHLDSSETGDDGTFALDRVPPDGAFMLDVTHDGYRPKYIESVRASGQPQHIRLDAGVRIEGTVVDERNRPILGAEVEVRVDDKRAKNVSTDKTGRFQAGGLDDGPIKIRVKKSGLGLIETAWLDVQPGERSIRIQATRGETISGRVVDAGGKAVKYVKVSALDEQGEKVAEDWIWSSSGKFRLKGLRPGTYRIKVGGQATTDPVFVEAVAAGTRDLVVTVR